MTSSSKAFLIAHRGASHYCPENTLISFEHAHQMGAVAIEFDCWLTKDQKIVLLHDSNLLRTTTVDGHINDFTFEEIQQLDAGGWFSEKYSSSKIPELAEILMFAQKHNITPCIEIKDPNLDIVKLLGKELTKTGFNIPYYVFSNHMHLLELIATDYPTHPRCIVIDREIQPADIEFALKHKIEAFVINHLHTNEATIQLLNNHDIKAFCFTVNDAEISKKLIDWGASAIISDKPDLPWMHESSLTTPPPLDPKAIF